MRKKPQGKVWSERTNSQTNAQMVVSSFDLFKEPMLLLIAVAVIYFVMGQNNEAYFMLAAIVVVSGISFWTTAVGLRWNL
jgi:Ca2+-transporting ATPase